MNAEKVEASEMATPRKAPPEPPEEFQRFEQLARKLANVPKEKVREKPGEESSGS